MTGQPPNPPSSNPGAPVVYGAPSRRPSPRLIAVVVIVVAAAVVGIGAWLLLRPSDSAAGSPQDAVEQLFSAVLDADCAGVEAVTTERYRESANLTCDVIEAAEGTDVLDGVEFVAGDVTEISDTEVEVEIQARLEGADGEVQTSGVRATVIKQGDRWVVDSETSL